MEIYIYICIWAVLQKVGIWPIILKSIFLAKFDCYYQEKTFFFRINDNFESKLNIGFRFCTRTDTIYFLTNMPIKEEARITLMSNQRILKLYLFDSS